MITANTKITALEVLEELGIENPADVFGAMRVRIGGIPGINDANKVINIPAETKTLEVIVGNKLFDLELAKGNKENNADVPTITESAKEVKEAEGVEATEKAEHLQKVKQLAKKIKDTQGQFVASKQEEPFLEEAVEMFDAQELANQESITTNLEKIKVKSK